VRDVVLACDVAGNHIYVGDFGNHRVQIFEKGNGNYVGQFGCKGRSI
jgi:DNA-binding beta-propeller fold protein YncE